MYVGGGNVSTAICPVLLANIDFISVLRKSTSYMQILIHVDIRLAWLHIGSNRISDRFVYRTSLIGCQTGLCTMSG